MKNDEAIELLKKASIMGVEVNHSPLPLAGAVKVAIEALERLTRKKPILWAGEMYICPECHRADYIKRRDGLDTHCGFCGQFIDWSQIEL